MKMNFKFPSPPESASSTPKNSDAGGEPRKLQEGQQSDSTPEGQQHEEDGAEDESQMLKSKGHVKGQESIISPSSIEVPPPPPVEKERSQSSTADEEDEVGDTVEVPLN